MGPNVILAINGLIALTELASNVTAQLQQAAATIQQAQSEGRDITDAELDQIDKARAAAVAAWHKTASS